MNEFLELPFMVEGESETFIQAKQPRFWAVMPEKPFLSFFLVYFLRRPKIVR